MKKQTSAEEKAAAAWLLLAYSLNHPADCSCEHCARARTVLAEAKQKTDAA
jgi:hypothetical protein